VAEYTIALLLTVSKRIPEDLGKDNAEEGSQGLELNGKTLGVIGAGKIGREVIKRANGFNMDVIAYDPYANEESARRLNYSYVPLERVLTQSDFISVNCPLTDSTRHLLSESQFELMDEAVIVNTARGAVIDSEALLLAAQNDSVKYAALDVVEQGKQKLLSEQNNIYITPHNAYNTKAARKRLVDQAVENLNKDSKGINLSN